MKVILAKSAGFCWGVRRAMERVLQISEATQSPVFTLGPLIHNPQTVALLESKNVHAVDRPEEAGEGTLVYRAHGIPPQLRDEVRKGGRNVSDATCPDVGIIASAVKKHHARGYFVVIHGKAGHAEVVGLQGYAGDRSAVVRTPEDVEGLPEADRVCLVSQSTMNDDGFEEVADAVRERYRDAEDVQVFNTICEDTRSRQREVVQIAREADAMVIVGGRNSSNTNHLAALARQQGTPTYHVETEAELNPEDFAGCSLVGVTAGASTPNWIIQHVVEKLESLEVARDTGAAATLWRAVQFLVRSNVMLAGGTAGLAALVLLLLGLPPLWQVLAAAALFVYSAHTANQHVLGPRLRMNDPGRASLFGAAPRLVWGAVVTTGLTAIGIALSMGLAPGALMAAFLAMSTIYRVAWVPGGLLGKQGPRAISELPGSKDVFMAGAWACILVGLPLAAIEGVWTLPALPSFGVVFALIAVRSAVFDLQDIQADRMVGKETLPIVLGRGRTRAAMATLLAVVALIVAGLVLAGACPPRILWSLLPLATSAVALWLGPRWPSRRQIGFEILVDGSLYAAGAAALLGWLL